MKTNLKQIASLLAVGLLAFRATATVLVNDNFDSYAQGLLPTNSPANPASPWSMHSGTASTGIIVVADPTGNSPNALQVSQALTMDVHANLDTNKSFADITTTNISITSSNVVAGVTNVTYGTNIFYAFSPTNPVSTLYSKYTIYVTTVPPGPSETYFGHFYINSSTFVGKLFLVTNGLASPGSGTFRIAIQNAGSALTNTIPMDLSANTAYTLVTRYVLSTGSNTVWLNPTSETSGNSVTPPDAPGSLGNILAYAFRQASTGEGVLDVDNFVTGTKFVDVVPGSINPPTFLTQPNDTNVFSSSSAIFSTLAAGDDVLGYQWYSITNGVTNGIAGATARTLTLTSLSTNQTGSIFCVVTNGAGTNSTRLAQLTVSALPIPPTIDTNILPTVANNTIGDTVSFTVVAHGLPSPAYQWKFVPATNSLVTNIVAGANITGTNSATLTLTSITMNQSGSYFVTMTNLAGYLTTNSAKAVLTVVPPPTVSIATLRGMVDPVTLAPTNTTSLFTTTGIVTTWTNLSTGGCEFFIQDSSGGICVYWSGAAITNLPPFGAQVKVTGALVAFNNLLELEPYYTNSLESVVVLSTNNQPVAHTFPFDPNVGNSLATMQKLEGDYFVASNVTLTAGATFTTVSAGEPITANNSQVTTYTTSALTVNFTNTAGETFAIYFNAYTDIPGKPKPAGPVTIYGVMGNYKNAFQFTPSRFADIVSYVHVTNILVNARKGDLATNSYTENVVRPGESLTIYVSVGDAAGGIVTLTPTGTLPTGAAWSGITSGATATAVLQYTGNEADAGNNFPVQLNVTSTAGTSYTETLNVYVPSDQEQQIAITEFLANPTTNPAAAFYNPLARSSAVNGISTNDQYIEIANQSGTDLTGEFTIDTGNASSPVYRSLDGAGATLPNSSSLIAYGGKGTNNLAPGLSGVNFSVSRGLFLPTSGTGVLVLRNGANGPNSPGYIIDRVVYSDSDLTTNGSLKRFPTINSAFAPEAYVGFYPVIPGFQYDGANWGSPSQIPAGVTGVGIVVTNKQAGFGFTAKVNQPSTLWCANKLTDSYKVINGQVFTTSSGAFVVTNLPAGQQFYYITTQTNGAPPPPTN